MPEQMITDTKAFCSRLIDTLVAEDRHVPPHASHPGIPSRGTTAHQGFETTAAAIASQRRPYAQEEAATNVLGEVGGLHGAEEEGALAGAEVVEGAGLGGKGLSYSANEVLDQVVEEEFGEEEWAGARGVDGGAEVGEEGGGVSVGEEGGVEVEEEGRDAGGSAEDPALGEGAEVEGDGQEAFDGSEAVPDTTLFLIASPPVPRLAGI